MAALAKLFLLVWACAMPASLRAAEGRGQWAVPAIPAGRRAQFFLQKADGGYRYGYDDGAGGSAEAAGDARNEVAGRYAYVGADGRRVVVAYRAGADGFVPHVEQPKDLAEWQAEPVRSAPFDEPSRASGDPNDASYNFSFDTPSYQRQEAADARGNVRGRYAYSSPEGGSHAVSYVAGEGTGFVVTDLSSSMAERAGPIRLTAAPARYAANADGSYSFSYTTDHHSREESADANNNVRGSYSFKTADGRTRRVHYTAGAGTGFVAHEDDVSSNHDASEDAVLDAYKASAPFQVSSDPNGAYEFSYRAPEQSRQEVADARNNVRGSYTYLDAEGRLRRVDYEAGAGKGFVARGDDIPVAVAPGSHLPLKTTASNAVNNDGSYTFAYDTNDHSRHETADARNNVRGSYTYKDAEGQIRRVEYEAGAGTGFVAKGDHIPAPAEELISSQSRSEVREQASANEDGSYGFSYSTGDHSRHEHGDPGNKVRGSYSYTLGDGLTRTVEYEAGPDTGFVAHVQEVPRITPSQGTTTTSTTTATPVTTTLTSAAATVSVSTIEDVVVASQNQTLPTRGSLVNKYIPPQSPFKYGYVYDSQA